MRALLPLIAAASIASATPDAPARAAIDAAMTASMAGWNDGDLGRFVAVYSDDALYATNAGLIQGRRAIAAHYVKSFVGGGNARGRLSFSPLDWRAVGPRHELLVARWQLTPGGGKPVDTGLTTLLFEHRGGRWLIVSDHSS